jgi:glucose-1-phosphate cytidylyltransferase
VLDYVDGEDFCFTYGDGVSDVDIGELVDFHKRQGTLATVTAVQAPGRYGALQIDGGRIRDFEEKPDGAWVNGGFFVLSPDVGRYIDGDATIWEREPMERPAREGELASFRHTGFWHAIDTLLDKNCVEELWTWARPPWRTWR